jgi:hypothetical protein
MSSSTTFTRPTAGASLGAPPPAAASVSGDSSSHRNTSNNNSSQHQQRNVDLSLLKNLARDTLLEALTDIQGQKTLVLDRALHGPLERVVGDMAVFKVSAAERSESSEASSAASLLRRRHRVRRTLPERSESLPECGVRRASVLLLASPRPPPRGRASVERERDL